MNLYISHFHLCPRLILLNPRPPFALWLYLKWTFHGIFFSSSTVRWRYLPVVIRWGRYVMRWKYFSLHILLDSISVRLVSLMHWMVIQTFQPPTSFPLLFLRFFPIFQRKSIFSDEWMSCFRLKSYWSFLSFFFFFFSPCLSLILQGIRFVPIARDAFLHASHCVARIENRNSAIRHSVALFDGYLVWAGVSQQDIRCLYRYLIRSVPLDTLVGFLHSPSRHSFPHPLLLSCIICSAIPFFYLFIFLSINISPYFSPVFFPGFCSTRILVVHILWTFSNIWWSFFLLTSLEHWMALLALEESELYPSRKSIWF